MLKKLLCLLLLYILCMPASLYAAGVTNFSPLITADYWTKNNPTGEQVILDSEAIKKYNAKIRKVSPSVVDLKQYPASVSGDSLKTKIMNYYVLEDDLYLHGNKVSENYKNILRKQTNIAAIPDNVKVRYAVTVRRSNLRNLPTGEGLYYFVTDRNFDALQETALDPAEPLAVLHFSANGFFYYVQSATYSGWISKYDIAFTDKNTWMKYVNPEKFLVVQDKSLKIKTGGEYIEYQLGAKLPVKDIQSDTYVLNAPTRNSAGNLTPVDVLVRKDNPAVHNGYLPYTANNIVRSAFKYYNNSYGWKGSNSSVDYAGLISNTYKAVGIILPLSTEEQETTAGIKHNFPNLSSSERYTLLKNMKIGSVLYMDGHAAIYLGTSNEVPYVIHALGSYYRDGSRISTMKVLVSDLSIKRFNEHALIDDLVTAVEFR